MPRLISLVVLFCAALLISEGAARQSYDHEYTDSRVFDVGFYKSMYPADMAALSDSAATSHWLSAGIEEGRIGKATFWSRGYLALYGDVNAYSPNWPDGRFKFAIHHYIAAGIGEGRQGAARDVGPYAVGGAVRVMTNDWSYSYDFSPTFVGDHGWSQPYMALFDAETWGCPAGVQGDSIGARYGKTFDFGARSNSFDPNGNIHPTDVIVARSNSGTWTGEAPTTAWDCSSAFEPTKNLLRYGAANPLVIRQSNSNTWGLYWIGVLNEGKVMNTSSTNWRHYLMGGVIDHNFLNESHERINDANMWYFTGDYITPGWGSFFHHYGPAAFVNKDMAHAAPTRNLNNTPLVSNYVRPTAGDTQGLLGSMTTGPDGTQYYFYTDIGPDGRSKLYRRTFSTSLVHMGNPVEIADFGPLTPPDPPKYLKVNYHEDLSKWVVVYYCTTLTTGFPYDICLQTFTSESLSGFSIGSNDAATYGIDLYLDPQIRQHDSPTNYIVGQFGIRKTMYGRHFTDADGHIVIYMPVGGAPPGGGDPGPYSRPNIYAATVFIK